MRYTPLPAEQFIEARKRLAAKLKPRSLVILHSNDVLPTNGDGTMGFAQNSDLSAAEDTWLLPSNWYQ